MIELESLWYYDENDRQNFNDQLFNEIRGIMNELIKEGNSFTGKIDRLVSSTGSFAIKYNNKTIGFIYAATEDRYKDAFFIDMAILKEYRGKGYGKQALKIFSEEAKSKKFLIAETKDNGTLGEGIAVKIFEDDYNYYLLPRSRYKEFMEFNKDSQFEKAILKDKEKRLILKRS